MEKIDFRLLKTSEIDYEKFNDISTCFEMAFQEKFTYKFFKWKYMDNPLGDSLHLLGYVDSQACMARNFWRTFNNGTLFQCVDTAVHREYQGMGLFKKSMIYMDKYHSNIQYYNYPNQLSIKQYLKYGWQLKRNNNVVFGLVNSMTQFCKELHWSREQAMWRYEKNPRQRYTVQLRDNKYYLFGYRKLKYPVLLGFTRFPLNLPQTKHRFCFSYDQCAGIYIGKRAKYITRDTELDPLYYMFDMS